MYRKRFFKHCVAILPLLWPFSTIADVYKYVDRIGNVYYTDKPSHSGYKRIIETPEPFSEPIRVYFNGSKGYDITVHHPKRSSYRTVHTSQNHSQYTHLIEAAASRNGLDPALLHAVIQAESSYNPGAVSHKGAMGLMQLMPGTAARYGVTDPYNPEENISGGARYLSDLLNMFDSDVALAVAAYNAGEKNVMKYGNTIPPFSETRHYVSKVLHYYNRSYE